MNYALIGLGAFLEIYYYFWRFNQDGIPWYLAVVSGVALTVLLMVVSGLKGWQYRLLFGLVLAYSVVATSSGQSHALGEEARAQATADVRASGRDQTVNDLQAERDRLEAGLTTITGSLWAQREYKDQVEATRAKQAQDEIRIREIGVRLEELRGQAQAVIPRENVYQYYGRVLGWNPDLIQIALQTILSLFFALMAPIGLSRLNPPRKENWEPFVSIWWDASMVPWKAGKGSMTSKARVVEFARNKGVELTDERYEAILKAGVASGAVNLVEGLPVPKVEDRDTALRLVLSRL